MSLPRKKYAHIIFDLDGTLSDSRAGIFNGLRYALDKMGVELPAGHDLSSFIGPPLHDSFYGHFFTDREKVLHAVAIFRTYYAEKGLFENEVYGGIAQLLRDLSPDRKLYVATNKPQPFAERILHHFKLYHVFEQVSGVDIAKEQVSKTDLVGRLIASFGIDTKQAVMIGDTVYDMEAAQAFGLDTIAVTYGYGNREELSAKRPTHMIDSVEELRALLIEAL